MRRTIGRIEGEQFFREDEGVFINRFTENFDLVQHTHDFVEVNYVGEGKGFHYVDDESFSCRKGDVFLIPLGHSHVFRPSSTNPREPFIVYNCLFRPQSLRSWHSFIETDPDFARFVRMCLGEAHSPEPGAGRVLRLTDRDGAFHSLFIQLYQEYCRKKTGYKTIMNSLGLALLGQIFRTCVPGDGQTRHPDSDRELLFEEILQELHRNFATAQMTAKDTARRMGMSPTRFQRLFRKHLGMSFTEYVQSLRIEKSCKLLRETSYSVQHIAELTGYRDMKHFHALFKRKTGITPHQYRLSRKVDPPVVSP